MKSDVDTRTFRCSARGAAKTQGSLSAFPFRRSNGTLGATVTSSNRGLKAWRSTMAAAFRAEGLRLRESGWPVGPPGEDGTPAPLFTGAVCVALEFALPRLAGHPKTAKGRPPGPPTRKNDICKLERAVNDSLTDALVLADDGLIVEVHKTKRYAGLGEAPGVTVEVQPV